MFYYWQMNKTSVSFKSHTHTQTIKNTALLNKVTILRQEQMVINEYWSIFYVKATTSFARFMSLTMLSLVENPTRSIVELPRRTCDARSFEVIINLLWWNYCEENSDSVKRKEFSCHWHIHTVLIYKYQSGCTAATAAWSYKIICNLSKFIIINTSLEIHACMCIAL